MKRMILLSMLVILLIGYNHVQAQFENPRMALGFSLGGAIGDNATGDKWGILGRGYYQYEFVPALLGQVGLSYADLYAPGHYTAEVLMPDLRLLFVPISLPNLNPFIYGGFGLSKTLNLTNSNWLPIVPIGVGVQTRVTSGLLLQISGGYELSLSDELDGRARTDSKNFLTNGKHDGFYVFSIGLSFSGSSEDADPDKDGLSNKIEKEFGTDPKNPDTDGDGLSDGDEVNKYRTDPRKADTDGDGLSDGDEILKYHTDPLKVDTDGDGLSDGAEVLKYHTDPLKVDTDGDGLNDGAEVNYKTDPLKTDTDGDGLSDGDEVNKYKTDPAKSDTDGDGLSDGDEVNKYKTGPLKIDSDGGGVNDGAEVKRGTNPLNPKDDIGIILEKGKKVILRGVNFETNKAILTEDSKDILEEAYKALVVSPDVNVEISGHTDNVGGQKFNQPLSLQRAQAVRNWLVKRGIASNRMMTVGKGELEPVADNNTEQGRAENRRIEFYVQQ